MTPRLRAPPEEPASQTGAGTGAAPGITAGSASWGPEHPGVAPGHPAGPALGPPGAVRGQSGLAALAPCPPWGSGRPWASLLSEQGPDSPLLTKEWTQAPRVPLAKGEKVGCSEPV